MPAAKALPVAIVAVVLPPFMMPFAPELDVAFSVFASVVELLFASMIDPVVQSAHVDAKLSIEKFTSPRMGAKRLSREMRPFELMMAVLMTLEIFTAVTASPVVIEGPAAVLDAAPPTDVVLDDSSRPPIDAVEVVEETSPWALFVTFCVVVLKEGVELAELVARSVFVVACGVLVASGVDVGAAMTSGVPAIAAQIMKASAERMMVLFMDNFKR